MNDESFRELHFGLIVLLAILLAIIARSRSLQGAIAFAQAIDGRRKSLRQSGRRDCKGGEFKEVENRAQTAMAATEGGHSCR